jgi:polysaccharide pyruvyl transferase WcaK-like protein
VPSRDGRPLIHLVATAGHPNFGDEFIAGAWLDLLAESLPEADVRLDCPRPGAAQELLDGRHPRLRCVDTLWQVCLHAPSDDPWEVVAFAERAVTDHGLVCRNVAGLQAFERADLVVLLGGGYLTEQWPRNLGVLAAARALRARRGTPVAMTGAGLAPARPTTATLVKSLTAGFSVVEVRDKASLEIAAGSDAWLGLDDAFLASPDCGVDASHAADVVLCLQADTVDVTPAELAAFTLATLRAWGAEHERLAYVECIPPDDRRVFDLLVRHVPDMVFVPFSVLWDRGLPVGPQQTWITTRFHPHLLAASAGAAGVAVMARRGYYDVKHQSLLDLGSGWTLVDDLSEPAQRPPSGGFADPEAYRRRKRATAEAVLRLLG